MLVTEQEALMTRDELADKLHHLDPGATLGIDPSALANIFGTERLSREVVEAVEAFALEHRCTFAPDPAGSHQPTFEKDDVF